MSESTTKRSAPEGSPYRQRAAQARAAAGKATDQPQSASLPEGSAAERRDDTFKVGDVSSQDPRRARPEQSGRADAAGGRVPRREQDMGRHETFGDSIAITKNLLSSTTLGHGLVGADLLDLAAACDWAVAHMERINDINHPDGEWPDERVAAEIQRFDAVLNRIADEPSQGIGNVAAKARVVLADWRTTLGGPNPSASERALLTLLREVGAIPPVEEPSPADPVDWHNPPPGFMASPAIEPTSFADIEQGIWIELERLRDIAQAEIDRRSAEVWEGAHETTRAGLETRLRRRFRLDEIKAALAPEMPIPAGVVVEGQVYYEDAAGQTWRQSVAHWVGFTAQRLYSVARQELVRQFNAACSDLDPAGCDDLHTRLTRELRIDALHALAFRSNRVFETEEARRQGIEAPAEPRQDRPGPGALVDDIIACWREGATIPEANREDGDPLYEQWWARRGALLNAADALPATRDSLAAKALAFTWLWGDDAVTEGQARADHTTDGRLALDIHAIACGPAGEEVVALAPDPFLAAVGDARAANAAVDAFGRRTAEHKPKGWFQEEQQLVAEQTRTQDAALAAVPTTQAGRIALTDYLAELMERYGMADGGPPDPGSSIWSDAYRALSAALRAPIRPEATEQPAAHVGEA